MKKIVILFIILLITSFIFAQSTYVPDDNFEQALIDQGYDTTLDDSVLTANISGVTILNVNNKKISDLTGIEDFIALTSLDCSYNQLTSLDVSKNTALKSLTCDDNQLTSLNVKNGATRQLEYFVADGNPNLTCIEILDPDYATITWTAADYYIDEGVTFAYICGVDIDGVATFNKNGMQVIKFNVVLPIHSLPDTNISLGFWKSGAENHECTDCNGRDTVSMRKLSDYHWEATVGLDTTLVATGVIGQSQYWYHYFKTIPDYKINEDLERFKLETNPDGLRGLMPGWHKVDPLANKDTIIAWQNIAPLNFDWVSSDLDTINISKTNLMDIYELKWTESKDVDIDTIDYLIYAQIGVYPAEQIYDTTSISIPITYQEILEGVFEGRPVNSATVRFNVKATDGIDTVEVTGDNRVIYVNRYEYLSIESQSIPTEFALHENYPNPFNPSTTLRFDLPEVSNVTLTIYNMLGQKIRTYNMQSTPAGHHALKWNATNDYGDPVGAGIYLYQLQTKEFFMTRKMVLLK